ncbi:TPA: type IV pilus assembly protein PilM [Candidatus Saccharibacteria bacterium]|nr:type IV pilus assembly protein PilM [Candidatus Saccharibacteria bacterium]HIO87706.1 type IV pilus assembly protein PilM [Candidatus Saccharibacteria bacterium]
MSILDKNVKYFGLDIGQSSVRLVELDKGQTKPVLKHYGLIPTDTGLESDAESIAEDLGAKIKQLIGQSKSSAKFAVVGLSALNSFSNLIVTPKLAKKDLEGAIRLQADQYIPMEYSKVKVDWDLVGETKDGQSEVFLAAAPKTMVNKVLRITQAAGLELLAIEVNAVAMARSLSDENDNSVAILNIDDNFSEIIIARNAKPYLTRSLDVGNETLIRTAIQNLNIDDAQAREFVYKFGLTTTKLEGQVYKALKGSIDSLVGEIKKSVEFYQSQHSDEGIEKLILAGGAASIPELPVYLANALNTSVEIANPWSSISYPASMQDNLMQYATQFTVAAGLALRMYK